MSVGTNIGQILWSTIKAKMLRRAQVGALLHEEGLVIRPEGDALIPFPSMGDRVMLHETFLRRPALNAALVTFTGSVANTELVLALVANKDFELLGTGGTADDVTFDPEGGILLTTDSSASQQCIILPHLATNQTAWTGNTWGTDQEVWWEGIIKTGAALADVSFAGLKLTNDHTIATDDDQVYFRFANTGTIKLVYSIGGVDVSVDTGVTAAVSTVYRLRIIIDSDRVARAYINGVLVATSAALTDAIDLIPYIGVEGNAKVLTIRSQTISRQAA